MTESPRRIERDRLEVRQRELVEPLQAADGVDHRRPEHSSSRPATSLSSADEPARRVKLSPARLMVKNYELSVRSGRGRGRPAERRPSDSVPKKMAKRHHENDGVAKKTPELKKAKGVSAARYSGLHFMIESPCRCGRAQPYGGPVQRLEHLHVS